MPIQLWKCNHCSLTARNEDIIILHERNCNHDPALKICHSCIHQDFMSCKVSKEMEGKYKLSWIQIQDGDMGACPLWGYVYE